MPLSIEKRANFSNRQANMDYSFAQACARVHPDIKEILVMYDVVCQWYKRLPDRIQHSPHLAKCFERENELKMLKGIGLFHVHGHQQSCFPRFSPDFIQGAGQVDGEVIETLWAILNDVSRCCRGMTAAHRQEVIDDHMNDSNWVKMTRLGEQIIIKALTMLTKQYSISPAQEISSGGAYGSNQ